MNMIRLSLSLSVVALTLGALAWIFGYASPEQSLEQSGRIIGAILIVTFSGSLIWGLLRTTNSKRPDEPPRSGQGPQF